MAIIGRMRYILALILLLLCYFCKAQDNFKDYCFKQISTEQESGFGHQTECDAAVHRAE